MKIKITDLPFPLLMMVLVCSVFTITSFMANFNLINDGLQSLHIYYFERDRPCLGVEPNEVIRDLVIRVAAILVPLVSCVVTAVALIVVEYQMPKKLSELEKMKLLAKKRGN